MTNVLVLGGTGMLRALVLRLLAEPKQVFVLARKPEGLRVLTELAQDDARHLTTMALDYHDLDRVGHWVAHVQLMHGPIDQVVAWVGGDREAVLSVVDQQIYQYRRSFWDLYDIRGSRAYVDPPPVPPLHPNCRYHRIILGFQVDHGTSRWLTHDEISGGIFQAMGPAPADTVVIGRVDPWKLRPTEE